MRNQFFGDNHDLFKYDLLFIILSDIKELKSLFYIPMLTPDIKNGHGERHGNNTDRARATAGYENEKLREFLDMRIKEEPRDFRKIKDFFDKHGNKKFIIYKPNQYFSRQNRLQYFNDIKDGSLQSSLIFLDPDNGFEVQKSDEKHLLYKEAENLCTRMGKDSVIAVIQFFPRVNHILYLKKRYNELKFHFGKTPLYIFDSQIIFLFLTKNPNLSNKLNRILESYKNTYGQLRLHYDQLR